MLMWISLFLFYCYIPTPVQLERPQYYLERRQNYLNVPKTTWTQQEIIKTPPEH